MAVAVGTFKSQNFTVEILSYNSIFVISASTLLSVNYSYYHSKLRQYKKRKNIMVYWLWFGVMTHSFGLMARSIYLRTATTTTIHIEYCMPVLFYNLSQTNPP